MKAEQREVIIEGIGGGGDGYAILEGVRVYAPGSLPGDQVQFSKEQTRRGSIYKPDGLISKGAMHQAAPCAHYSKCGGCSLQHLNTEAYQNWLIEKLIAPLARVGIQPESVTSPLITAPKTRRRLSLKAIKTGGRVKLGYLKAKSHQLVVIEECPVADDRLVALFDPLKALLNILIFKERQRMSVQLTLTSTGIDILLDGIDDIGLEGREAMAAFAEKHDIAALHMSAHGRPDPIIVRRTPQMHWSGAAIDLPPAAFLQATDLGETSLQAYAVDGLKKKDRVLDLFAGIGTFAVPMAQMGAHVIAAEGALAAFEALDQGAKRQQLQVKAVHRDLFRQPYSAKELEDFDRVVIDPPRAGAEAQAKLLAGSDVPIIISISCNPATFTRDAQMLVDGGYKLVKLQAVDQFLWSNHLEVAARFERH